MPIREVLDARLRARLAEHGSQFAPEYAPQGFSDHLPMACMAMSGLGAPAAAVQKFASGYAVQLKPASAFPGYQHKLAGCLREIGQHGTEAVLRERLPPLISGWVREAYHPLIRIGYGVEFEVAEEVAAGLAYLQLVGGDERLETLAKAAIVTTAPASELFQKARTLSINFDGSVSFTERTSRVIEHPGFASLATVIPDNLRQMSRGALDAFAASHDFFALHLITGSHAFRVLLPYAGPLAQPLLNLGLLAGFVAAGAPVVTTFTGASAATADWLQLIRNDEHDWKLAWSARQQSAAFGDSAWIAAVDRYLRRSD
jgi:hypothetical protein